MNCNLIYRKALSMRLISFMRHRLYIYSTALIMFMGMSANAQDVQFSQFYAHPLYLNPALTGSHAGTFRIMANYRDQWRGTIEQPFTTFSASGDMKFQLKQKRGAYSRFNDVFAVGVQFTSDRVSDIDYNTNGISLSAAYHKMLEASNKQYLSLGILMGIAQRGINYEDLTFGDQWNGATGYSDPTAENLPSNSLAYNDIGIGLHYSITPDTDKSFYIGASLHHLNQPNVSFFNRDVRNTSTTEPFKLPSKFSLHGGISLPMNDVVAIQPRAIYIQQGKASTFVVGTNFKYKFLDSNGVALHLGGWLRGSDNLTTFQPTDIILSAGYEKLGMLIGISYDIHLRQLSGTPLGQGMFELSIAYTGEHDNDTRICPSF